MIKDYPIVGGVYKHYKGGYYKVLHLAKHSETEQILVIYQSIHFGSYHARPLDIWNLKASVGNYYEPRFSLKTKDELYGIFNK